MNLFNWPRLIRTPSPKLAAPLVDAVKPACPSTSVGAETVRGITLLLAAACLATVVLVTQRVLQWWVGDDLFLAWTVTWCVLLAAMQWLLRSARGWAQAALQWLDDWSQRVARQRAQRRSGVSAR
jgi:peptidoglycan/LPS O-acetylase OafA/YrhL